MARPITARTRVFSLIGDPVAHSYSPAIHNAAMADLGLDGVYTAVRSSQEEVPGLVRGLALGGGGGNVTLPHKERAATVVDSPSAAVRRTGACNTFWLEEGGIRGDNTDVEGFGRALEAFVGGPPQGYRALVLGAGGAARAALVSLIDGGALEVHILNRSRERARVVARRIGGERVRVLNDRREAEGGSYDLVVNATSLGLNEGDPLPLDLEILDRVGAVVDMVYGKGPTPFLSRALELGIRGCDGGEMLLHQAAVAFERWWEEDAPLKVMRQALEKVQEG